MTFKIKKSIVILIATLLLTIAIGCKRESVDLPSPVGPSTTAKVLTVTANPNTIYASDTRDASTIKATFEYYDGTPIVDKQIIFEITNENGIRVNLGRFAANKSNILKKYTNSQGKAQVIYEGPLHTEIGLPQMIYIYVHISEKGQQFFRNRVPIMIIPSKY